MQSYLIIGTDAKARLLKAEELIGTSIVNLENSPDFFLIGDGENAIGIDQARELQKKLSLKPFQEKQKYCLITQAQNLTLEAQNSLLKTLEEPPSDSLLILTAPDSNNLLPTVISRCQILSLANQPLPVLSSEEKKELTDFINVIIKSPPGKIIVLVEKMDIIKDRNAVGIWLDRLIMLLREVILNRCLSTPKETEILLPANVIIKIIDLIYQTKNLISANINIRLAMENFLFRLTEYREN